MSLFRSWFFGIFAAGAIGLAAGAAAQTGQPGPAANPPGAATQWIAVRGNAIDLTISPRGDVYALDPSGHLLRLSAEEVKSGGGNWSPQPGQFRRVRATHDGTIWAVGSDGWLYRQRGSAWYPVVEGIRDVAATPDGQALGIDGNGELVDLATRKPFEPAVPPGLAPLVTLVLDAHGLPWLQRADRGVIRFDGTGWQTVARPGDGMAMVAAGYDGSILGIAEGGQIMRYAAAENVWRPYLADGRTIPPMRLLALSPIGLPWGISRSGQLLAERSVGVEPPAITPAVFTRLLSWRPTGRMVAQVSVGEDGSVYALAPEPDGGLYRRAKGNQWNPVRFAEGKLTAIAAGTGERVWGLTEKGGLVQFDGGFQQSLPVPARLRLIAPGPKGTLWAVVGADELQQWNAVRRAWEQVTTLPQRAVSFAIGNRGEPWMIDEKGVTRTRTQDNQWKAVAGIQATSVSIGPDGTVYGTSADQGVYWLDSREMRWKPASGKAVKVAVGPGGAALAIAANKELLISGRFPEAPETTQTAQRQSGTTTTAETSTKSPSAFVVVPPGTTGATAGVKGATTQGGFVTGSSLVVGSTTGFTVTAPKSTSTKPLEYQTIVGTARFNDVGIGASGAVFATSTDGSLMCFNNAAKSFVLASSGGNSRVAVAPDGSPWILDANGKVMRFDRQRAQWRTIGNFTGIDLGFGPDGQLWGAGSTGSVFRFNSATESFDLESVIASDVSFRARRIAGAAPVSGGRAYWVISEQNQLLRCEKGDCRTVLVGAADAAVAPDNTLFVLDLLGNVQRYDAAKKAFEKQNGNGSAIAVGPGGLPWLVTTAGKVDAAGIYAANSKTINAPDCAVAFTTAPTLLPPPPSVVLVATADTGTLAPGASLSLLANDSFAGRAANISDVTVSLDTSSPYLSLSGGSAVVATTATAGTVLNGSYKICPRNVLGNCVSSTVSITVSGTSTAPTAVTAVGGSAQATVSFTAPGVGGVSSYTVVSTPGSLVANGSSSPITVLGLSNGVQYSFTVTAKFSNGTSKTSEASNLVTPSAAITEPTAPTIGTATAGNAQASVSFTAPASNGGATITGYKVTSLPGGITATGTASPITVTGLTNGTAYTFTVQAQNSIGYGAPSAASNSVTPPGAVATAPGAPTGPVGTVVAPAVIQVSFTAPASDGGSAITGYTVISSPGGLTGTGASSPIAVTGLTGGTLYTFTVTATNAAGIGAASAASAGVTAEDLAGPPTALTDSTVPASTQIDLSWGAPVSNGGSPVTDYLVACTGPAFPGGPTGGATSVSYPALPSGAYSCTVGAINAWGPGTPAGPVFPNP